MVHRREDLTIKGFRLAWDLDPGQELPKELQDLKFSVQFLNSEYGKLLLSKNEHNRNISVNTVEKYRRDLEEGKWLFNGSAVSRDTTDNTLDGQHRGKAATLLDDPRKGGWTMEILGLDPAVRPTIDGGRNRSFSDDLKISGEEHCTTLAAITRRAFLWEVAGHRWDVFRSSASRSGMGEYFIDNRERLRWATKLSVLHKDKFDDYMATSTFGFMLYLCTIYLNEKEAIEFWVNKVAHNEWIPAGHVSKQLQARLKTTINEISKVGQARRVDRPEALAWCIKAWNMYQRDKETVAPLEAPRGGWNSNNIPMLLPTDERPEYPRPGKIRPPDSVNWINWDDIEDDHDTDIG